MNVRRAITGSVRAIPRLWGFRTLLGAGAGTAVAVAVLISLSAAEATRPPSKAVWLAHHEACHRLPEELYHRDRFRAIRGRVTDDDGKPIAGALVRCARLESLVALAGAGIPSPSNWSIPIEAETTTDDRGQYEFPHLPVGGRTFFYSTPGRDLSPAIKDMVVVQDGLGAQLNVTLARPATLRVKVKAPRPPSLVRKGAERWYHRQARESALTRLVLIPHRWWPTLPTADLRARRASECVPDTRPRRAGERIEDPRRNALAGASGSYSYEFRNLGGPLRQGLIAAAGPDDASPLRVVGRYDLDQSPEAVITGSAIAASLLDLPEAAGIESWHRGPMRASQRLFYAAMSPIALFWPSVGDDQPLWLDLPLQPLYTPPLSRPR